MHINLINEFFLLLLILSSRLARANLTEDASNPAMPARVFGNDTSDSTLSLHHMQEILDANVDTEINAELPDGYEFLTIPAAMTGGYLKEDEHVLFVNADVHAQNPNLKQLSAKIPADTVIVRLKGDYKQKYIDHVTGQDHATGSEVLGFGKRSRLEQLHDMLQDEPGTKGSLRGTQRSKALTSRDRWVQEGVRSFVDNLFANHGYVKLPTGVGGEAEILCAYRANFDEFPERATGPIEGEVRNGGPELCVDVRMRGPYDARVVYHLSFNKDPRDYNWHFEGNGFTLEEPHKGSEVSTRIDPRWLDYGADNWLKIEEIGAYVTHKPTEFFDAQGRKIDIATATPAQIDSIVKMQGTIDHYTGKEIDDDHILLATTTFSFTRVNELESIRYFDALRSRLQQFPGVDPIADPDSPVGIRTINNVGYNSDPIVGSILECILEDLEGIPPVIIPSPGGGDDQFCSGYGFLCVPLLPFLAKRNPPRKLTTPSSTVSTAFTRSAKSANKTATPKRSVSAPSSTLVKTGTPGADYTTKNRWTRPVYLPIVHIPIRDIGGLGTQGNIQYVTIDKLAIGKAAYNLKDQKGFTNQQDLEVAIRTLAQKIYKETQKLSGSKVVNSLNLYDHKSKDKKPLELRINAGNIKSIETALTRHVLGKQPAPTTPRVTDTSLAVFGPRVPQPSGRTAPKHNGQSSRAHAASSKKSCCSTFLCSCARTNSPGLLQKSVTSMCEAVAQLPTATKNKILKLFRCRSIADLNKFLNQDCTIRIPGTEYGIGISLGYVRAVVLLSKILHRCHAEYAASQEVPATSKHHSVPPLRGQTKAKPRPGKRQAR